MKLSNADLPAMPQCDKALQIFSVAKGFSSTDCAGLTKREMFAMAAMQGILSNGVEFTEHDDKDVAQAAVIYADNLLAELERTK